MLLFFYVEVAVMFEQGAKCTDIGSTCRVKPLQLHKQHTYQFTETFFDTYKKLK